MGCSCKCQCGSKSDDPTLEISQITIKVLEESSNSLITKKHVQSQKIDSTMISDTKYFSSPDLSENHNQFDAVTFHHASNDLSEQINYQLSEKRQNNYFSEQTPLDISKESSYQMTKKSPYHFSEQTSYDISEQIPYEQAIKSISKFPAAFVTLWSSDDFLLEGELMRYRPGISQQFISRWCQVTNFEFMYFKNQYSAQCWFDKPLCLVPLCEIKNVKRAKFKVPEKQQKYNKSNNLYQFEIFLNEEDQMTQLSRHADESPISQILILKASVNDLKQSVENGKLMKRPVRCESPEKQERKGSYKKSQGYERISWSTREIEWFTAERRLLFSAQDEASCLLWISTIQNAIKNLK